MSMSYIFWSYWGSMGTIRVFYNKHFFLSKRITLSDMRRLLQRDEKYHDSYVHRFRIHILDCHNPNVNQPQLVRVCINKIKLVCRALSDNLCFQTFLWTLRGCQTINHKCICFAAENQDIKRFVRLVVAGVFSVRVLSLIFHGCCHDSEGERGKTQLQPRIRRQQHPRTPPPFQDSLKQ